MLRGKNRTLGEIERWEKSKNQTAGQSGAEKDHVIVKIFCLLLRQDQKQDKKLEVQVFLVRLLVPLSFAGLSRFCLVLEASVLGLTVGLTIGRVESIGRELVIGLSE